MCGRWRDGWGFDLGRMTLREPLGAYATSPAIHLAHRFHDERGSCGITSFALDRLFGTYYGAARERRRSPHVFNLGHDLAEAARFPWVARLTGAPPRDRPPRPGERV